MVIKENSIIQGDCLQVLKELEDNSVDAIVTDPPYALGFMGKSWDTFDKSQFGKKGLEGENDLKIKKNFEVLPRYNAKESGFQEFCFNWAKECLRVLKPGGHLLSFGGTRTYHRMASAIEDAGFEIRDMIEWVYSTGFPKSLNIGKAVDKLQGNEREVRKEIPDRWTGKGNVYQYSQQKENNNQVQITKGNSEWEGWGTALKPAHEPICMARKPLAEKTVAENCLKYGTGGINIDESRVEGKLDGDPNRFSKTDGGWGVAEFHEAPVVRNEGRFPANLIHDGSEEVRGCFPDSKSTGGTGKIGLDSYVNLGGGNNYYNFGDSGNASRFFKSIIYQAKASKSERNKGCEELEDRIGGGMNGTENQTLLTGSGNIRNNITKNNHPTVKPIALMEYLIKMVTPKGGIVLDPFAGSGTTLVASKKLGYKYIGIELTPEYIPIINARLSAITPTQK